MKDLNLTIKTIFRTLLLIGFVATLGACSKGKKGASLRNQRTGVNAGGGIQNVANPSSGCANCGWIYNGSSDMSTVTRELLNLDAAMSDLGTVSGQPGQSTGIVFSGTVAANGSSGNIKITVWDSIAAQTGQGYQFTMELDASRTQVTSSSAHLEFYDSFGRVILQGQFHGTTNYYAVGGYQGTVSFVNNSGYTQQLGNFATSLCGFVHCDGVN